LLIPKLILLFKGFEADDNIDGSTSLNDDYNYFSLDPSVKYYFRDLIFSEYSRFPLYGMTDPGFFFINESNISFNIDGGLLVWLNKNHSFGVKLQSF
jgi:hypothetical protein